MQARSRELKEEIGAKADGIIASIQQHKVALAEKVEDHYNIETEMLSNEMQKSKVRMTTLQTSKNRTEYVLMHGHKSHKVELKQKVDDTLDNYESSVADRHSTMTHMKFTGQDMNVSTGQFGSVSVTHTLDILSHNRLQMKLTREISVHVDSDTSRPDTTGIAVHPATGDIITADYKNNKLKIFTKAGKLKWQVSHGKGYQLKRPWDVTVLQNGNMAITNFDSDEVVVLAPDYKMISKFKSPYCKGIAELSNGVLAICTDKSTDRRVDFKSIDGATVLSSLKQDKLRHPQYTAVTLDNKLIISDTDSHNIPIYNKHMVLLHQYSKKGTGDGQLNNPWGVCVDRKGHIIAADRGNNRIQVLSLGGKYISNLVTGDQGLCKPQAVAIASDGQVIVSEQGKDVIKVFEYLLT